MPFFSKLRHTPATAKPPGTTTTTSSNDPLVNLSTIQSRMDSVQKFLSDSVNSNTLLSQRQMDLISNEITSAIHQIIVNGAALVSSTTQSPVPPPPPPPTPPAKSNRKRTYSELEDEDGGGVGDWEIIELDAVELLAEHIHFCDFCGKGFKRDANLRMHMRAHGNQYKTPEALAKPEKIIESGSGSGTGTGSGSKKLRFSCPFVGCTRNKMHNKFRPLKSAVCVKNHFKRSHCPKMYTCTRCNNKSFSVLADLKSHVKHCGETKWKCSCGTHFSRKDKLFGHMALFEGHMPAVDQVEEDLMTMTMTMDVEMGPDNGPLDISGGSDNGFLDRLMLDGFESIDNYCFQDLLESSSPNGSFSTCLNNTVQENMRWSS